jgi:hypothetical protein
VLASSKQSAHYVGSVLIYRKPCSFAPMMGPYQYQGIDIMSARDEFRDRVYSDWLGPYCDQRGYAHGGFIQSSLEKLSEADASDFLRAVDHGVVTHQEGAFKAACSKAKEYLFWEGASNISPRPLFLWLEPVITIAGLWRLHHKFGWPAERLGAQSVTFAFDFVGYQADQQTEWISCEVKPTRKAVDFLITFMTSQQGIRKEMLSDYKATERNALKKVIALRESSSQTFWALGPDNYGHVFVVSRDLNGQVILTPTTESALYFE